MPRCRVRRYQNGGGARTVPCAVTKAAAAATMAAAQLLWPRRSYYGRGAVTMAAAQLLWPRRSHYDRSAVTMTTSAHHGPIGRRLQIIDRLPARRDYLRTARLDTEFIDRRPGAHVIATQARRSRARVARRSRSTTGGSAAGDALVRNHEPAENRANDVIAEGASASPPAHLRLPPLRGR